jgi:hypothetical protein
VNRTPGTLAATEHRGRAEKEVFPVEVAKFMRSIVYKFSIKYAIHSRTKSHQRAPGCRIKEGRID